MTAETSPAEPAEITPSSLIEEIGLRRIAQLVGVGETAVMNARKKLLPSRWYKPLKELCDAEGRACPMELFNWATAQPLPEMTGGAE